VPTLTYFKTFLKDYRVGAFTKSSKFAVAKVCDAADFSRDAVIVEYGAGDGVVTNAILERMTPHSRLIAIESNPFFLEKLSLINDSRLIVVHDIAQHLPDILATYGIADVHFVFSSIPFSLIKKHVRREIVTNTFQALAPGGSFIVYQYSTAMSKMLKNVFGNVRISFIPLNFPSYFLMEAKKRS